MTADALKTPRGLKVGGTLLWQGITEHLELEQHERAVLLEWCRVQDRLDWLHDAIEKAQRRDDLALTLRLMREARDQEVVYTRLGASLRLPDDIRQPFMRPQRRGGARGAYRLLPQEEAS